MSLKAFHLIFVVASLLMSLAVGVWGVQQYLHLGEPGPLWVGLMSLVAGGALAVYGARIRAKFKELPR